MKNLLVSLVVVGALSAPMVYAQGEAAAAPAEAAVVAPVTEVPAGEKAEAPKKKHHANKKKKQGKKKHKCKDCHHKKAKTHAHHEAEGSNETAAEKKIDQETELNNR